MDIKQKAKLISEFAEYALQNIYQLKIEAWFDYNDMGIPLAICIDNETAQAIGTGEELIDETYKTMCKLMGIDNKKDYEDIEDMLEESVQDFD